MLPKSPLRYTQLVDVTYYSDAMKQASTEVQRGLRLLVPGGGPIPDPQIFFF